MPRKALPPALRYKLFYDSQYLCAICQKRGSHVHHIDQDNSNDQEDNLVVLCPVHHDDAHTKRQLSQNLTAEALRDAKQKWIAKVKETRHLTATLSGQLSLVDKNDFTAIGVTWGYINHRRVGQLARPDRFNAEDRSYFNYCKARGLIDQRGLLIKPTDVEVPKAYVGNSVYDWYQFGDDQRLHLIYAAFVDQISRAVQPVHLERESWTKARIEALVSPGDFLYLERGFYFKCVRETRGNQHRRVHTFRRKIVVEFYVDTVDMFGTTSMTVSFTGHNHCAALLLLKSLGHTSDGGLILSCTPIALGVAFRQQSYVNPFPDNIMSDED
jgi:hypothetical protein